MRPNCIARVFCQKNNEAVQKSKMNHENNKPSESRPIFQHRKFSEDWGRRRRGPFQIDDFFDRQLADAFQNAVNTFQTSFNNPRYRGEERAEGREVPRGGEGKGEGRGDVPRGGENRFNETSKEIKPREGSTEVSPFRSFFSSSWNNFGLKEKDDSFEFTANIESFDPKDIKIEVKDGFLHVAGKSKEEKTSDEGGFKRTHKSEQSFHHKFFIPENSEINQSKANFADGCLTIQIPKLTKQEKNESLEIPIDFAKKD